MDTTRGPDGRCRTCSSTQHDWCVPAKPGEMFGIAGKDLMNGFPNCCQAHRAGNAPNVRCGSVYISTSEFSGAPMKEKPMASEKERGLVIPKDLADQIRIRAGQSHRLVADAQGKKFVVRYFVDGKTERREIGADGFESHDGTLYIRRDCRMVMLFAPGHWHSIEELP